MVGKTDRGSMNQTSASAEPQWLALVSHVKLGQVLKGGLCYVAKFHETRIRGSLYYCSKFVWNTLSVSGYVLKTRFPKFAAVGHSSVLYRSIISYELEVSYIETQITADNTRYNVIYDRSIILCRRHFPLPEHCDCEIWNMWRYRAKRAGIEKARHLKNNNLNYSRRFYFYIIDTIMPLSSS